MENQEKQQQIESVKRTMSVVVVVALAITFCLLVHCEWIHPYPAQYRIITDGETYKIQEKNYE